MNPLWAIVGLVAVGGGYYAYTSYKAAEAASPQGQLEGAISGLAAQAESAGAGVVETVTKYGKYASPIYDGKAIGTAAGNAIVSSARSVANASKSAVATVEGWF